MLILSIGLIGLALYNLYLTWVITKIEDQQEQYANAHNKNADCLIKALELIDELESDMYTLADKLARKETD